MPKVLCRCDICGEDIYVYDPIYKLPDGSVICAETWDCLEEWAEEYKQIAE